MFRITDSEHGLAGRHRVHHAGAAAGDDEVGDPHPLLLEELLLARDEVLAVHERRDAVRHRDRLPLRTGGARPARGERGRRERARGENVTPSPRHSRASSFPKSNRRLSVGPGLAHCQITSPRFSSENRAVEASSRSGKSFPTTTAFGDARRERPLYALPQMARLPPLRRHLVVLVLVTLAPVLAFAVWLVFRGNAQERAQLEHGLEETAEALSTAVDREIDRGVSTLQTLATSENLRTGDLERFRTQAAAVVLAHGGLEYVLLADASGRQLMNVLVPAGEPLPPLARPELIRDVLENGHALVSERGDAGADGHLLIGVRSPILRAGRSATLLVASVARRSIGNLIAQHTFPPGWTATIYNREGHVLATSDVDRAGLGRPATPAILDAVARKATGVAQISTTDRQRFYAGFARPSLSGWVVTVGVPLDAVEASRRRSLPLVAAPRVPSILLALGAALVIGRRIADPLVALAAAAPAVVRGERVALPGSSAREIADLFAALKTAADDRESAEQYAAEAHRLLRAVFDGTTDGVFVKDLGGRYVMINEAGARLIGQPVEDIVDHDDTTLFDADSAARIAAQDREVIITGEPRTYENFSVATAAGHVRSYLSTKAPYRDATGRIVGVIGITRARRHRSQRPGAGPARERPARRVTHRERQASARHAGDQSGARDRGRAGRGAADGRRQEHPDPVRPRSAGQPCPRRSRPSPASRLEPGRQCDQVHTGVGPGPRQPARRGCSGRDRGRRHRRRHRRPAHAVHLRALPARRQLQHAGTRRARARTGAREASDRAARRHRRGRQPRRG